MCNNYYFHRLACLLCFGMASIGCNSSDGVVDDAPMAAVPVVQSTTASATPETPTPNEPELTETETPIAAAEFAPPFPNRLELFEPPKRAQGTLRRNDEHGETVELKGFIHVDQPRVVLSIDGVVSPIAAGGEKYGVQVIAITPPSVVLQRGRDRWTATLE